MSKRNHLLIVMKLALLFDLALLMVALYTKDDFFALSVIHEYYFSFSDMLMAQ